MSGLFLPTLGKPVLGFFCQHSASRCRACFCQHSASRCRACFCQHSASRCRASFANTRQAGVGRIPIASRHPVPSVASLPLLPNVIPAKAGIRPSIKKPPSVAFLRRNCRLRSAAAFVPRSGKRVAIWKRDRIPAFAGMTTFVPFFAALCRLRVFAAFVPRSGKRVAIRKRDRIPAFAGMTTLVENPPAAAFIRRDCRLRFSLHGRPDQASESPFGSVGGSGLRRDDDFCAILCRACRQRSSPVPLDSRTSAPTFVIPHIRHPREGGDPAKYQEAAIGCLSSTQLPAEVFAAFVPRSGKRVAIWKRDRIPAFAGMTTLVERPPSVAFLRRNCRLRSSLHLFPDQASESPFGSATGSPPSRG